MRRPLSRLQHFRRRSRAHRAGQLRRGRARHSQLLDAYRSGASARARQAALDAAARQAEIELEFVSGWEIQ